MRKTILLLLVGLVLIGGGCGKEDYNIYKSEKWGYQIAYPFDWTTQLLQDNEQGMIIVFMSPSGGEGDKFSENVSAIATTKGASEDFDEEASKGIETLDKDESKDLIEDSKISLAGLSGYKIIYSETTDKGEFQYLQYWLEGEENRVYMIMFTAEKDKYSEYLKQAEKIIDSFKVL